MSVSFLTMKVFVISLKKSEHRRVMIRKQLDDIGIDYEIVDAIDGSSLSPSELGKIVDLHQAAQNPRWLNNGAIGCAASHLLCYEKILREGLDFGIVLEDDAIINKDILSIVKIVQRYGWASRCVYLLYYRSPYKKITSLFCLNSDIDGNGLKLVKFAGESEDIFSAVAYIITRSGCKSMLDFNRPVCYTADSWSKCLNSKALDAIYAFYPRPCGFDASFDSTIDYSGAYFGNTILFARRIINSLPIGFFKMLRRRRTEKHMSMFKIY